MQSLESKEHPRMAGSGCMLGVASLVSGVLAILALEATVLAGAVFVGIASRCSAAPIPRPPEEELLLPYRQTRLVPLLAGFHFAMTFLICRALSSFAPVGSSLDAFSPLPAFFFPPRPLRRARLAWTPLSHATMMEPLETAPRPDSAREVVAEGPALNALRKLTEAAVMRDQMVEQEAWPPVEASHGEVQTWAG